MPTTTLTPRVLAVRTIPNVSVALAEAFDEQGLGLLCMLDDNEHAGLESFEATYVATLEDGTRV